MPATAGTSVRRPRRRSSTDRRLPAAASLRHQQVRAAGVRRPPRSAPASTRAISAAVASPRGSRPASSCAGRSQSVRLTPQSSDDAAGPGTARPPTSGAPASASSCVRLGPGSSGRSTFDLGHRVRRGRHVLGGHLADPRGVLEDHRELAAEALLLLVGEAPGGPAGRRGRRRSRRAWTPSLRVRRRAGVALLRDAREVGPDDDHDVDVRPWRDLLEGRRDTGGTRRPWRCLHVPEPAAYWIWLRVRSAGAGLDPRPREPGLAEVVRDLLRLPARVRVETCTVMSAGEIRVRRQLLLPSLPSRLPVLDPSEELLRSASLSRHVVDAVDARAARAGTTRNVHAGLADLGELCWSGPGGRTGSGPRRRPRCP